MKKDLTEREQEVLELIIAGHTNSQIAEKLEITLHTAKAHVQAILYKLGVKNRIQAAIIGLKQHNI
ncbi:MAG: LuxR C-terminal-related transcriptional regulator [Fusobacterium sp.]|nr:LuxR C-terminal-related transcriptional regulator [Fusobacterium sp.]